MAELVDARDLKFLAAIENNRLSDLTKHDNPAEAGADLGGLSNARTGKPAASPMIVRRIRLPRPHKEAERVFPPPVVPDVFQRDDGRFSLGFHDDAPAFETRQFAAAVAATMAVPA